MKATKGGQQCLNTPSSETKGQQPQAYLTKG